MIWSFLLRIMYSFSIILSILQIFHIHIETFPFIGRTIRSQYFPTALLKIYRPLRKSNLDEFFSIFQLHEIELRQTFHIDPINKSIVHFNQKISILCCCIFPRGFFLAANQFTRRSGSVLTSISNLSSSMGLSSGIVNQILTSFESREKK